MLKLKDRNSLIYSAFLICLIEECQEQASNLWATETNIIDLCEKHFKQLQAEAFKS
jgi:hypothetical protein